ncbi:hypothetical protein EYC80_002530 [Monilinia laxa]|uniref:Uncharacterized protein n=1 Tax=Monilinia laxa TaxID=61186 RepID=A0A5N6K4C7_MONLA|nr:hypothetical protein EYC80_002530 [Monilinia laxa]
MAARGGSWPRATTIGGDAETGIGICPLALASMGAWPCANPRALGISTSTHALLLHILYFLYSTLLHLLCWRFFKYDDHDKLFNIHPLESYRYWRTNRNSSLKSR